MYRDYCKKHTHIRFNNLEPTGYDTSPYKEYKKLQKLICRNEKSAGDHEG
ncbi:MAG: hypothetical protein IKU20_11605 [Lachnospiraceae bacterium]|nr:hypothetical protein [Lachnospiraceae bacterium]